MPGHRLVVLMLLLVVAAGADATVRTWPAAAAPCNTTLQACIDGSAAADTVFVHSNATITNSLTVNKPFILRAGPGYRPVIDAGFAIGGSVNAAGSWTWHVEGFELRQGFIAVTVQGGSQASIVIRNNRVLRESTGGAAEISVAKASAATTTVVYDVSYNELHFTWNTFDGALRAALQVLDNGTGSSSGRIRENRVHAAGNESIGILVSTVDRAHRSEVFGNRVAGGRRGSIFLRQGSLVSTTGGALTALVVNNVVSSILPDTRQADGIRVDAYDGALTLHALHNTVVDAFNGIDVFVDASVTASGEVGANLFAYLASRGLTRSSAAAIGDRDNLFFETTETPATPGLAASSIFADPRLRSVPDDPRLRADSPAVDRLTATEFEEFLALHALPRTDGDGLRRFKHGNAVFKANLLDVGALEAGDDTLLVKMPLTAPGNTASINDPLLNGFVLAAPQQTANWNPDGGAGIYNDHPVSLRYNSVSSRWVLRQEDLLPFSAGAAFNVFAPGRAPGRFEHLLTAGNTSGSSTVLDQADLNGRADQILLVTRNPGNGPSITDVVSPLAVRYVGSRWTIVRLDGGTLPLSGGFNVYFQAPSGNAFRHRASAGNTFGNTTDIDHPLLNGHRCARFHVTQSLDSAVVNDHQIGVFYVAGEFQRWSIFNQDTAAMPPGAEFHVVVDPASVNCPDTVFANGFE